MLYNSKIFFPVLAQRGNIFFERLFLCFYLFVPQYTSSIFEFCRKTKRIHLKNNENKKASSKCISPHCDFLFWTSAFIKLHYAKVSETVRFDQYHLGLCLSNSDFKKFSYLKAFKGLTKAQYF